MVSEKWGDVDDAGFHRVSRYLVLTLLGFNVTSF